MDPESGRLTSKGSTMLMNDLNYDSALYTSINDQKLNWINWWYDKYKFKNLLISFYYLILYIIF